MRMPADHDGAKLPMNRRELIRYFECVVQLTQAEDATAAFLLRLLLNILKGERHY
jgi:hypothetical protein